MTRVLQAMAGGPQGGAEQAFVRLATALRRGGLDQRILIRRDATRATALRQGGIEPVELAFGGPLDLRTGRAFRREVAAFAPAAVLTWMSRATRFCPRARGRVAFVHAARLGGYYDLKNYRHCDHLVGNTPDIVDWLVRSGWPRERCHYLPNFVSAAPAAPLDRATLATPADAPLLLALGRLHPNKAFDVLLTALGELPGVWLWLAGAGPLEAELKKQAGRLGLADRVRFLGWREDVAALYAAADLFVLPSRAEPFGNVVVEAWAQRRPVVAAASLGPKALIRPGENGLLAPVDDAAALAGAIRQVVADRSLAKQLSEAGWESYRATFTEPAVVARYLEFFARIAG